MIHEQIAIPAGHSAASHMLDIFRFGARGARPCVYIQAALHADEIPGMACAVALRRHLAHIEAEGGLIGEVILVPVANPIGLGQRVLGQDIGRFDLADGGNFNRDFPALGRPLIAELAGRMADDAADKDALIRRTLGDLVAAWPAVTPAEHLKKALLATALTADLVLDLHCDSEAVVHLYTHSRSARTFAPLGARLGAKAFLVAEISGGDPFDEALSRPWVELAAALPAAKIPFGCQSVTVELRGQNDVSLALAEMDAAAIIGFLQDAGVLAASALAAGVAPAPAPDASCAPTPLAGSMPLIAPLGGMLTYRADVGTLLAEGDIVADITDPLTGEARAIAAPCDGVFFARSASRFAMPGRRLGKVAGTTPQRAGKLLSP